MASPTISLKSLSMPLILVGAVFLGLFRDHLQHFHTQKLKIITRENICRCEVEEALTFVQRKQLLRAQQELLDLDSCTPPYHPATGYVYRTREGRANNGNMDDVVQQVVGQGGKNQGTIEANKQKMAAAIEANKIEKAGREQEVEMNQMDEGVAC